jgi:hypothetical protein
MTTDAAEPLNPGLYRVHRIFFVAFAAFAVVMAVVGTLNAVNGGSEGPIGFVGIGVLPLAALHWFAAKGARLGQPYGRVLSRIIGTFWLIGIPLGTILGIYVWSQTGKKWRAEQRPETLSTSA